ncbi:chymotrypsin-like protease CTRL-1 [Lineus longissimus]|uniref:chymotrypsin-like protease CTRL-1 n=1 Tax=Lineus longissimus TaxID=88925 RepID=UPI00315CBB89
MPAMMSQRIVCFLVCVTALTAADPTGYRAPLCEILRYGRCQSYTSPCTNTKWEIAYCPSGQVCCQDTTPKPSINECSSFFGGTCMSNDRNKCDNFLSTPGAPFCPENPSHICCLELRNEGTPPRTDIGSVSGCGVPINPAGSWRVVGGTKAQHGAWPWQVSIQIAGNEHICGGTIIDKQWILTAAHCFPVQRSPLYYLVRVGEHRLHLSDGTEVDHYIAEIIVHEKWLGNTPEDPDDIALLKLVKPVTFNDHVKPVCLATEYDEFESHQDCWVTGWGETKGTGDNNYLQQLQSNMVSNSECNRKYWIGDVKEGMACFGESAFGACVGDSGGPLVCRRQQKFYQVGVVSWGSTSCVEYGASSVFTRVAHYLPWIQQMIARYS